MRRGSEDDDVAVGRRRAPRRSRGRGRASPSRSRAGSWSRAAAPPRRGCRPRSSSSVSPWTTQTESDSSPSAAVADVELRVRRLHALLLDEHAVEHAVRPVEHAADRAEVLDELRLAARERAVADRVVDGDVGAAEAVDRLLRVADDGEAAGPRPQLAASPSPGSSSLAMQRAISACTGSVSWNSSTRIDPEAAAEVVARLGARREQVARPLEQVVEVGRARGLALGLVAARRTASASGSSATIASRAQRVPAPRRASRARACAAPSTRRSARGSSQSSLLPRLGLAAAARGRGARGRARPGRRATAARRSAYATIALHVGDARSRRCRRTGSSARHSSAALAASSAISDVRAGRRGLGRERQQRAVARAPSRRAGGSASGRTRARIAATTSGRSSASSSCSQSS